MRKVKGNRGSILFVVCLLAVTMHIWGIYLLHVAKIHIPMSYQNFKSHEIGMQQMDRLEAQRHEKLKRSEQLIKALNYMVEQPVEIEDKIISFEDLECIETPLAKVEDPATAGLADESGKGLGREDAAYEFQVENIDVVTNDDSENILPAHSVAVVFPGETGVTENVVRASSIRLGEVMVEDPSMIGEGPGIAVGSTTGTGSSLQNRTGLVNEGISDSIKGGLPEEVATAEMVLADNIVKNIGTVASSDDFVVDVHYAPRYHGEGYVFKLTMLPRPGIVFKRIRQNMFFLVDRSNSINRQRYKYTKSAVVKALEYMHPGDTFNILVFDKKVIKLADENLSWNRKNIDKAKNFLRRLDHGGLFATTELYASLDKIVPDIVSDTEVNTAILLSDGDTFLNREEQRKTIADWTNENKGKVSLFSVASGKGNNLPLLQVISMFNKGILLYSPQDKNIDKSLQELMLSIRNPIGKDIIVSVVVPNDGTVVKTYPQRSLLPDLYENMPYVVYGSINRLEDFHVFLQGKYYDKWLDIKQKVSFSNVDEMDIGIEREWTVYRAFDFYDRYLQDGEMAYLEQAKRLLIPMNIPVAFE